MVASLYSQQYTCAGNLPNNKTILPFKYLVLKHSTGEKLWVFYKQEISLIYVIIPNICP